MRRLRLIWLVCADGVVAEAEFVELLRLEEIAAVEEEGRFVHLIEDRLEVEIAEFVPLGEQGDRVGVVDRSGG